MPLMHLHPNRVLALEGATNFRDLGGYLGHGGRAVRWRRLFRSEHLAALTAQDRATLQAAGISRAYDFRGEAERASAAYQWPGLSNHHLSIEPTVVQRLRESAAAGHALTPELVAELMKDLYRGLVTTQSHHFATLFEALLQTDSPLVFHCTAGKDRTGVAAALILLALGVSREDVARDYLLTNDVFRHTPKASDELPAAAAAVLWRVQAGFLDAALQTIEAQHGGVDAYLGGPLGLSAAARQALADRYLAAA
jgi:protein-tyrosine phosphatase